MSDPLAHSFLDGITGIEIIGEMVFYLDTHCGSWTYLCTKEEYEKELKWIEKRERFRTKYLQRNTRGKK